MKGLVPNFGIEWDTTERRGTYIIIPKNTYKHTAMATRMRSQSLVVHGGRICNLSMEVFKTNLDIFLAQIPDHPVSPGLTTVSIDPVSNKHSNSLYDWMKYLKLSDRKFTEKDTNSLKSYLMIYSGYEVLGITNNSKF